MPTHDELIAVKDRAAATLMRLPNVTAVGIGGRVRNGRQVNQLVLKVYVSPKLPSSDLDPSARIPAEIEGLPTDVVEMSATGHRLTLPTGSADVPMQRRDVERYRPVIGGGQMMSKLTSDEAGTLGCIVVSTTDPEKAYALTNWHVMQGAGAKDPVIGQTEGGQPTNNDSSTKCCSDIIGVVAGGARNSTIDAALVALKPGTQWSADVVEIGPLKGGHPIDAVEAGTHPAMRKRGMRTTLTGGTIDSIGPAVSIDEFVYTNVIVITPRRDPSLSADEPYFFAEPGDSGAVVVDAASKVIGIILGGPNPPASGYTGAVPAWCLPLKDVTDALAAQSVPVQVAVAATAGIVHTVPGAAMIALPEEVAPALIGAPVGASARERLVPVGIPAREIPSPATLTRLEHDLDRSERGRTLISFWLCHQRELLDLIGSNRRVAVTWHRSGAAALFQLLSRMLSQPELTLPRTVHGQPVDACLNKVAAVFDRFASEQLRIDLARLRDRLPELGGLNYAGLCSALATN